MRVLTELEKNEFNKTYDFLNHWVGTAAGIGAKKISEIRFDDRVANAEIIKFVNGIGRLTKVEELNLFFKGESEILKLRLIFNDATTENKKLAMDRLINYCFNNRVQPHKLRMRGFKNYSIKKEDVPVVVEFGAAA